MTRTTVTTRIGLLALLSLAVAIPASAGAATCPPGTVSAAYCEASSSPGPLIIVTPTDLGTPPAVTYDANDLTVTVLITCPSTSTTDCDGTIDLYADNAGATARAASSQVLIGSAHYHLSPGAKANVAVPLNAAGKTLVGTTATGKSGQGGAFVVSAVSTQTGTGAKVSLGAFRVTPKGSAAAKVSYKLTTKRVTGGFLRVTVTGKVTSTKKVNRSGKVTITLLDGHKVRTFKRVTVKVSPAGAFVWTARLNRAKVASLNGHPLSVVTYSGNALLKSVQVRRPVTVA